MAKRFLIRDSAIVALATLVWLLHRGAEPVPALEPVASVGVGLLIGVSGYLIHEWAHYLGGLAAGSQMGVPESLRSLSLFDFDPSRNSREQFVAMSLGGFAATAAFIAAGLAWLPLETLAGRVAMGSLFFLAFLGVVLEIPLLIYGLWANDLPPVGTVQADPEPSEA